MKSISLLPHVYALVDPRESDHLRYIGKTINEYRAFGHLKDARNLEITTRKCNWIRKLLSEGIMFEEIILEEFPLGFPDELLNELLNAKEMYYIAKFRLEGHDLTNSTEGGGGILNPSDETRAKIRDARVYQIMKDVTPETLKKMSESQKLSYQNNPERREQQRKAMKDRRANPKEQEHYSLIQRNAWANPEERAKRLVKFQTPEFKEKCRIVSSERWKNEEYRRKQSEGMNTSEHLALMSITTIEQWEDPVKRQKCQDAQLKAKRSDMSLQAQINRCKDRIWAWKNILNTDPDRRERAFQNIELHTKRLEEFQKQLREIPV